MSQPFRILSLDGGGIMRAFTAPAAGELVDDPGVGPGAGGRVLDRERAEALDQKQGHS
jgi:hypothetical protein